VAIEMDERRRELAREVGADEVLEGGGAASTSCWPTPRTTSSTA
jgi:hypothetical protein